MVVSNYIKITYMELSAFFSAIITITLLPTIVMSTSYCVVLKKYYQILNYFSHIRVVHYD